MKITHMQKTIKKVKRYRLDKERIDGTFCGALFFDTTEQAEKHLSWHKYMIDFEANAIPNNARYGTIWEI